jgi:O-antigen/teichoic acid export membrane protein
VSGGGSPPPGRLTRLFLRNTAANLALRVVGVGLSLWAARTLIHHYGDTRFSALAVALQAVGLVRLVAPGLSGAFTREVAAHTGRADLAGLSALVRVGSRLYLGLGLAWGALLVVFGLADGVAWLTFPREVIGEVGQVFVAAGLLVALRWPLGVFADALAGLQEFPRLAMVRSVSELLVSLGVIGVARLDGPLWAVLAAHAAVRLVEGLVLRAMALARLPRRSEPAPKAAARGVLRPLLRIGAFLALLEVATLIHFQTDQLVLIGLVSAPAVTAYYATARLHNLVRELSGSLASALAPLVAREAASGNRSAVEQVLYRGTRYNLALLLPVVLTAVLFAGDFLGLWLGEEYASWGPLAAAFVGYFALAAATSFVGQTAVGTGHVAHLGWIAFASALLNLGLSVALAPRYGVAGVVGATVVAYVVALPLQAIFVFPRVGVSNLRFLREVVIPIYPPAAVLLALLWWLRSVVPAPASFVTLILQGAVAGLAFLAAFAVTALDPRDRARLLGLLRRRAAPEAPP